MDGGTGNTLPVIVVGSLLPQMQCLDVCVEGLKVFPL